ncbi:MAG: ferritin-like domain-containing protein [Pseudomonadota bacterium]
MHDDAPVNVPIDPMLKASLIDACCHVLGNTFRISRITLTYQWNTMGQGAFQAEGCFKEQADELHTALTPIAEHIRGLGGVAILDYSDQTLSAAPSFFSELPSLSDMFQSLIEHHREACLTIEAAIDIAQESADWPSIGLLSDRLATHRRHAWRNSIGMSATGETMLISNNVETRRVNRPRSSR